MKIHRRQLLLGGLAGLGSLLLYRGARNAGVRKAIPGELAGAAHRIGHQIKMETFPPPSKFERKAAVIVGAGISGLAVGYHWSRAGLSDFVLLDLERQFGGNAQGGANAISAYPWGAHYVPLLAEESHHTRKLFEDLGVITGYDAGGLPYYDEYMICHDPDERLYQLGRWQEGLVPTLGLTDQDKAQYRRFFALMPELKAKRGQDGLRWFAIPLDSSSNDAECRALDKISMAQWLQQQGFNSELLRWYVNYCCRDDFGATLENTSAWAGLHYFAARNGQAANTAADSVITWPEGNGWLAAQLAKPCRGQIINQALCYAISETEHGIHVDYYDEKSQQSIRIETQAVVVAVPRFVAARLLARSRFSVNSAAFSYTPWAVANISLSRLPVGRGNPLSWDNVVMDSELLGYVNATHQQPQMRPTRTVITYYWPLTHSDPDATRREMMHRTYADWQRIFVQELLRIHPELSGYVEKVDIWLWGHGMVKPSPGFIWGEARAQALIHHPPVYFAHSDMSGISIFEEAYERGVNVADEVLAYLKISGKPT